MFLNSVWSDFFALSWYRPNECQRVRDRSGWVTGTLGYLNNLMFLIWVEKQFDTKHPKMLVGIKK